MKSQKIKFFSSNGGRSNILGKIKKNWNRVRDVVQSPIDSAQATTEDFGEDLEQAADELGEDIQGGLDDIEEAVEDFGEDLGDAAGGFVGDIFGWIKRAAFWLAVGIGVFILIIVMIVKLPGMLLSKKKPAAGR